MAGSWHSVGEQPSHHFQKTPRAAANPGDGEGPCLPDTAGSAGSLRGGALEAALHVLALLQHAPQPLVAPPKALLADAQLHLRRTASVVDPLRIVNGQSLWLTPAILLHAMIVSWQPLFEPDWLSA